MAHPLRKRFWLELALAVLSLAAIALIVVSSSWVEKLTGLDPDQGSGALEWAVVAFLVCATASMGALARSELRRAATATG
jgi:hypothetical protein